MLTRLRGFDENFKYRFGNKGIQKKVRKFDEWNQDYCDKFQKNFANHNFTEVIEQSAQSCVGRVNRGWFFPP